MDPSPEPTANRNPAVLVRGNPTQFNWMIPMPHDVVIGEFLRIIPRPRLSFALPPSAARSVIKTENSERGIRRIILSPEPEAEKMRSRDQFHVKVSFSERGPGKKRVRMDDL